MYVFVLLYNTTPFGRQLSRTQWVIEISRAQCAYAYICMHIYTHSYTCIYIYTCIYLCMYTCMYLYRYITPLRFGGSYHELNESVDQRSITSPMCIIQTGWETKGVRHFAGHAYPQKSPRYPQKRPIYPQNTLSTFLSKVKPLVQSVDLFTSKRDIYTLIRALSTRARALDTHKRALYIRKRDLWLEKEAMGYNPDRPNPWYMFTAWLPDLRKLFYIVQYKHKNICSGGQNAPGPDPPHKTMRHWLYYSTWLCRSFLPDQNGQGGNVLYKKVRYQLPRGILAGQVLKYFCMIHRSGWL